MHRLFFWLRKLVSVVLVAVGLLAGLVGICWTVVFASIWFKGEPLSPGDRRGWLICAAVGIGGGLALWAGAALLRSSSAGPKGDGSLRLRETGRLRRRSVNAGLRNTSIWVFVAAEFCLVFIRGDVWTRTCHALEGMAAFYLGFHAIILLHELGHLGLAAVLGLDLQKLQVGTGPMLLKGRIGGLRMEWRAWLGGGYVLTADDRERGWRWRHWFYVAGGPVCTLGGCIVLAWWIGQRHRGVSWFNRSNGVINIVAMFLCAHSALLWLVSMLPKEARVGTLRAHTDGYQLLHTPRFSSEEVRNVIIVTSMRRVEMLWEDGRRELAWARLRELLARYPAQPLLSVAEGHYLEEQGDYPEAATSYRRWLELDDLPQTARSQIAVQRFRALARAGELEIARECYADTLREVAPTGRAALLDVFATEVLTHELNAFLPEADAWSQEAMGLEPETITLKGTRGAVLVELGRFAEGEKLLREVWAASGSEVDAAISAYYLGVAEKRQGREREFFRWLRRSKGYAPYVGQWLLGRIGQALAPT